MRWKALATDLDGTLLDAGGQLSARNREALRAAKAAGLGVILATARWYRLALPVAAELELDGPMIACQGAEVRRISDHRDLLDQRLPDAFSAELFALCDAMRCLAWIPLSERVVMKGDYVADLPDGVERVESLAAIASEKPRMALIQGRSVCDAILGDLKPRWADRVRFSPSISSRGKLVLTLTASEVNKGAALSHACADLGIATDDVLVFGDAENDIEMFEVAGGSFAMGQAAESVKRAARRVAPPNTEDGVAQVVEDLLRGGGDYD
ncbi:MAG: HAD family phosphatase [Myxococcales bacterium]|nr:HAD family phosphatase [Myxococcales bacterium]